MVLLAKPGLSVFHTQPGVVLTEMNRRVGGSESFKHVKTDDGECTTLLQTAARLIDLM